MKNIIFIMTLSIFSLNALSAGLGSEINTLFDTLGISKFKESIKKIKAYKSVEQIDDLNYELKAYYSNVRFWYFFDQDGFVRGLKSKLKRGFNTNEIQKINRIFKKPFNVKVLNAAVLNRDIFNFHHNSMMVDQSFPELAKSRYALIKNIYILHGMSIQNDNLKSTLKNYVASGITSVSFINKRNGERIFVDPTILKKRYENSEDFTINYLASDLKEFRHYELREYIRIMKGKTIQKFLQVYANYHYLYFTKYLDKVQHDKLNAIKVLGAN